MLYDARGREIWACPNVDAPRRRRGRRARRSRRRRGDLRARRRLGGDHRAGALPLARRGTSPTCSPRSRHVGMLGDWVVHAPHAASSPPTRRSGRARACSTSRTATWSERVLELVGLDAGVCPAGGRVRDGRRRGHGRARPPRPGSRRHAGRRRRRRHPARAARDRRRRAGPLHASSAAASGSTRCVLDQPLIDPERAPADALPHRSGPVDDRGHRLLLRPRDALVPRRLLRRRVERRGRARRRRRVRDAGERAAGVPPGANGVFGIFSNLMHAEPLGARLAGFIGFDITDPGAVGQATSASARSRRSAAYVSRGHRGIVEEVAGAVPDEIVFTGGAANGACGRRSSPTCSACPCGCRSSRSRPRSARRSAPGSGRASTARRGRRPARPLRAHRRARAGRGRGVRELYPAWLKLYARMLELAAIGVVRPLWRAAGT